MGVGARSGIRPLTPTLSPDGGEGVELATRVSAIVGTRAEVCYLMTLCVTALFGETQVPIELIIENVPDEIVAQLEMRAQINQRSLDAELLAILEAAVHTPVPPADLLPPAQA